MTAIREIARFSGQEAEKTYSVREKVCFPGRQFFLQLFRLANVSVFYETVDYSIGMITDVGYFFPVQTFWEATLVFVCSDQTPG